MSTMPYGPGYGTDPIARQMAMDAKQDGIILNALAAALKPVTGSAAVPALSLGASTTVTVPLSVDLGSSDYQPIPVLYGTATLLGGLTLTGIVAKTGTSVTVGVKAPLVAVAAGATLTVTCFRI